MAGRLFFIYLPHWHVYQQVDFSPCPLARGGAQKGQGDHSSVTKEALLFSFFYIYIYFPTLHCREMAPK